MASIHQVLALVAVGAAALLLLAGAAGAWLDTWHTTIERLALAVSAVLGVQAAVGLATLLTGGEPGEGLHILYGLAMAGAVPLASSFASDAPPRARSAVLAVGALAALLVAWRLFATG